MIEDSIARRLVEDRRGEGANLLGVLDDAPQDG